MLALSPGQADILPRVGETWNTPGDKVGIEQPQATPIGEEEIQLSRASVSEWYCYTETVPSQNKTATNYFSESKIPCRQRQYQKKTASITPPPTPLQPPCPTTPPKDTLPPEPRNTTPNATHHWDTARPASAVNQTALDYAGLPTERTTP